MEVAGKKAVIFGGTSGIGLATAKHLSALRCSVVAVSRNPDRLEVVPEGVVLHKCDVLDVDSLTALLRECAPIDFLISAATGGSRAIGQFLKMNLEGYRASFDKLWGYANVVRHGTEHLTANGNIVLVSGTPARHCKPGQVSLSSVGASVEALVRAVSPELAPRRINVVSPGVIDTPILPIQGAEREAFYTNATSDNLIPRAGTADEVAQAIIFLVQNEFVTGTTIDVDGGWMLS